MRVAVQSAEELQRENAELRRRLEEAERQIEALEHTPSVNGKGKSGPQTEDLLRQSEERYRLVAEAANAIVWDWDLKANTVERNDGLTKLFGYPPEEISTDTNWGRQYIHPEDRDRVLGNIARAMESGEDTWENEYRFRKANGEYAQVFSRGRILRDEAGIPYRAVGSMSDITERTRAEAALRESEERFRTIADTVPVHVWMDDEDGKVAFVNARNVEFTGHVEQDILGKPWPDLLHPEDKYECMAAYQAAVAARIPYSSVARVRGKDGFYRWFEIIAQPRYEGESFTGYVGINIDITERKRAEETRRASEERFRTLADHAPVGIFMTDVDGDCLLVNSTWAEFSGFGIEQAKGRGWTRAIHPDDRARVSMEWYAAVRNRTPFYCEHRILRDDGKITWVQSSAVELHDGAGALTGFIGTLSDITERKRAEEQLRSAQQQLSTVANNMLASVAHCSRDLRYIWVNKGYCERHQLALEEITGRHIEEVLGSAAVRVVMPHVEKVLAGECIEYEAEADFRGSGRQWFHAAYTPIFSEDGKVESWVAVVTDITPRKLLELALQEANEGLARTKEDLTWQVVGLTRLHEMAAILAATLDLDTSLKAILSALVEISDADHGLIYMYEPEAAVLKLAASVGIEHKNLERLASVRPGPHTHGSAAAFAQRVRNVVENTETDPLFEEYRDFAREVGFQSVHCTPIITRSGDALGVLSMKFKKPRKALDREQKMADLCARQAADAIEVVRNQKALRESEQRFRNMADTAPAMLWITDASRECAFLSRGWYEYTGQCETDSLGAGWLKAVHPEDRQAAAAAFGQAHEHHEAFEMDFRLRRHDGEYRWVADAGRPRFSSTGHFMGYIGSVIDISERKDAETRLREAHDGLERRVTERTAQLRALALELSQTEHRERRRMARELHDNIQQLLVAIKMQATFAKLETGENESIQGVIRLTEEAIAGCRALVVGLSPPLLRDAELPETLQWLARHMKEKHGLEVSLIVERAPRGLTEDLRSILFETARELLFNVVKHGNIDRATLTLGGSDKEVWVEISDEGAGCDPALLERPSRESFGLFSIRERLAVLGGSLFAESAPGAGCKVVAVIPSVTEDSAQAPEIPANIDDVALQGKREDTLRVLLADDHQILRQGLARLLSSQPDMHVIAEASNGVEAIELARKLRPDVIVMDITMPEMGGVEATRRIRAEMPEIRVIGLSMHDSEEMAKTMREAGADAYLSKDGPLEELLAILRGA